MTRAIPALLLVAVISMLGGCSCSEWSLVGSSEVSVGVCGNGIIESGEACDDANSIDWDGCNSCTIAEFIVNSTIEGYQQSPSVSGSVDGRVLIAWVADGVFGQFYNRDGSRIGTEFKLNEGEDLLCSGVDIHLLDDARFIATWIGSRRGERWSETVIEARWFASDSLPIDSDIRVDRCPWTTFRPAPSVAAAAGESSVLVWSDLCDDSHEDFKYIHGGIYSIGARSIAPEFSVSFSPRGYCDLPSVDAAPDGTFIVVWQDSVMDGDSWGVLGMKFDISGHPIGSEFQVNTSTAYEQSKPAVAVSPSGRFVVVWEGRISDSDTWGIYGQLFDADCVRIGHEFLINESPNGSQSSPDVAVDERGNFVVVWDSSGPGDIIYDIAVRRFDDDGHHVGAEIKANVFTSSIQSVPKVSMIPDGRFVVVWQSKEQLGGEREFNIFAQRFDSSGNPLGTLPW
jgi:cysteine-rich repeat protein